jgi:hypothetical protein
MYSSSQYFLTGGMYLLCLVQTTRMSKSPDAVDSLVSFFGRGWEDLSAYQSLNREFLPCPITYPPRDTVNDRDKKYLQVARA